jgi:hypothetical protein
MIERHFDMALYRKSLLVILDRAHEQRRMFLHRTVIGRFGAGAYVR